jgi:predicted DNA-binding mobile mystery protein A
MNNHRLTIKQLDKQLKEWQAVSARYGRPRTGWVKTLREALCMTAAQLGERLGVTRGRVVQLEEAEINDAVTLRTLKEAANAMKCEFIYAIVPKKQISLEELIKAQIESIANRRMNAIHHTMLLENQALDATSQAEQKKYFIEQLQKNLGKEIWKNLDKSAENDAKETKHLVDAIKKILKNSREKK